MPVSPSRRLAYDVLEAVEERGAYAADLLHGDDAQGLSLPDRRLATEIVMGVLRWRAQLDYLIGRAANRNPARIDLPALLALRMAAYQLRFLDRVPAMAAVHESVEIVKRRLPYLAGFANAVLRHLPTGPVAALLATENDLGRRREVEFSHPAWMLERWSARFGPDAAARIAEYDNAPPPAALRFAVDAAVARAALAADGITVEPGSLLEGAYRVTQGDVSKTELFRDGGLWLQDEASQLMAALVNPRDGDQVLDACAAPGGKTTMMRTLAPGARIMALDLHPHRIRLLRRLLRDGSIVAIAADAARPLPITTLYDRILVDAPCSGTGTLARNPEIRWRLRPDDLARLAEVQFAILRNVANYLKPGGRLVYSVCSLESEEGAEVVRRLERSLPELRVVPAAAALAAAPIRVAARELARSSFVEIPSGRFGTDGFFAAVLERKG